MGRVKTQLIKKMAFNLVRAYGDKLTSDFKQNKELMLPYIKTSSKKLKNAILGYATRIVKMKKLD